MKSQNIFSLLACMAIGLFTLLAISDEIKDSRGDLGKINDPVQDAKQAYHNGIKEFVAIKLEKSLLLPGLKPEQEKVVRNQYAIRALNQRWQSDMKIEQDPRRMNQLKRYANRYNLMMIKLIKQEELDQQRQYQY